MEALLVGGLTAVGMLLGLYGRFRRPVTWPAAAAALGFTEIELERSLWTGPVLTARAGDLRVRISREVRDELSFLVIRVAGDSHRFVPLSVRAESVDTTKRPELAARDVETGDFHFDDAFYVTGPAHATRAVLDAATRQELRAALARTDVELAEGAFKITRTEAPEFDQMELIRVLARTVDVARRLRRPADVPARLAENARLDPVPGVRLESLLCLVRDFPDHPATAEAVLAASADPSDDVRVRAAAARGEAGRAALLEIATSDRSEDLPAARAIAALGRHLGSARARELLGRALRARKVATARACLLLIARDSDAETVALLAKVLGVESGELAVAAAEGLAQTRRPEAERPLLAALDRDVPAVRVAAAEALGRIGSVQSVPALRSLETRHAGDAELRRAARQAVAQIQSRAEGASPGQLSLAEGPEGAVSLAEDERGRVSFPPPRS